MKRRNILTLLIILLVISYGLFKTLFIVSIDGNSMAPTYSDRDRVLATKFFWHIETGDVIVFLGPDNKILVKRIETIEDDSVYVIGDNVDNSEDSRDFGPIKRNSVLGKVISAQ